MRVAALLAACFALACGGRGPWRAISREAETAADIISPRLFELRTQRRNRGVTLAEQTIHLRELLD